MVWVPKKSSGGFWIDQTLVTADAFAKWFATAKGSLPPQLAKLQWEPPQPPNAKDGKEEKVQDRDKHCNINQDGKVRLFKGNHPANCVTWAQAERYCHARGARLPEVKEWQWAAAGNTHHKYPWGNEEPDNQVCWRWDGGTCEVNEHVATWQGRVAQGAEKLYDMVGNVSQFTSTPNPHKQNAKWMGNEWGGVKYLTPHPCGTAEVCMIVGGHWANTLSEHLQLSFTNLSIYSWHWSSLVGFRCVRDEKNGAFSAQ